MNPREVSRLNGGNWRRRRWRRRCWFVCLLTDERQLCSFISCRPTQKLRCARKAFACDQLFLQLCLLRPPFAYVNNIAKIAVIACFCRQMLRIRTDSTAPKFIVRIRSIGADCRLAYRHRNQSAMCTTSWFGVVVVKFISESNAQTWVWKSKGYDYCSQIRSPLGNSSAPLAIKSFQSISIPSGLFHILVIIKRVMCILIVMQEKHK